MYRFDWRGSKLKKYTPIPASFDETLNAIVNSKYKNNKMLKIRRNNMKTDTTAIIAVAFVIVVVVAFLSALIVPLLFPNTMDFFVTESVPQTYDEWIVDQNPRSR